ncbi:MAG: hypothetical protein RL277_2075 [Planctomycetota bacterium]|jgi:imidazolonepropionase-like amidohydrolase
MLLTIATAFSLLAAPAAELPATFAIRAGHVLLDDSTVLDGGMVLVEDGRIRAIAREVDLPENCAVVEHAGWLSAGLVGLHSMGSDPAEMRDATRPVLDAEVAWAFNPRSSEYAKAAAAGITTLVLTPSPRSLSGGVSAVVKTGGGRILSRSAHLSLGFSAAALSLNAYPTSFASAVAELNNRFEKPSGAFARARAGELPCLFEVATRADVQRASEFSRRWKLRGAIYGADLAGEQLDVLSEAGLAVIVAPLSAGADRRSIQSTVKLAASDIAFGFGVDNPMLDPQAMRFTAGLCIREGMDRKRAWRALTTQAAELAGVAKHVGSLQKGRDADLVLWSGNPLELSSGVQSVYIDGKLVHEVKKP